MNRLALGLAVGAGYVLGRTKKMKLAFALGTLAAGKKLNLSPRALAELLSQQLQNNPQFKEIGDELRQDLRGVGKAASGALVERQIKGLADRLHGRTADVRDQLSGVAPDLTGEDEEEPEGSDEDGEDTRAEDTDETEETEEKPERSQRRTPAKKTAAKRAAGKAAEKKGSTQQAARKTAAKAPAKKGPAKKQAATKTAARRSTRTRAAKGGGGDD